MGPYKSEIDTEFPGGPVHGLTIFKTCIIHDEAALLKSGRVTFIVAYRKMALKIFICHQRSRPLRAESVRVISEWQWTPPVDKENRLLHRKTTHQFNWGKVNCTSASLRLAGAVIGQFNLTYTIINQQFFF
jgi:hypothetical protein